MFGKDKRNQRRLDLSATKESCRRMLRELQPRSLSDRGAQPCGGPQLSNSSLGGLVGTARWARWRDGNGTCWNPVVLVQVGAY